MKYLNKKSSYIIFILAVTLLFFVPYISQTIHDGHDLTFHLNRLVGLSDAISDRQFLPKVYPYTNYGFGYATSLFYCDLFLIPFAIIYKLGVPLIISFKLMIFIFDLASVISIFFVSKYIFKNNYVAPYISTILYTFSNYHFCTQYLRMALGEIISLIFIPIIFLAFYKIFIKKKNSWILLGMSYSLILLSHNISFVLSCILFGVILVIYTLMYIKNICEIKRIYLCTMKAVLLALLLSSFFLMPMLEQIFNQVFNLSLTDNYSLFKNSILSINSILYPIFTFDYTNFTSILSLGLPLVVIPTLYIFTRKKDYITILLAISIIFILCILGIIPLYKIKILSLLQFVWRLYLLLLPILSLISAYIIINLNRKYIKILLVIIISWALSNSFLALYGASSSPWNFKNNSILDEIFDMSRSSIQVDFNQFQISAAEYLPPTENNAYYLDQGYIKEIYENTDYNELYSLPYNRNGTRIEFTYNSEEPKLLMLPQTYYKGYQVFLIEDDGWTKLETINVPRYKQVGFYTLKGEHTYMSYYAGTKIQKISLGISSLTIICLVCYLLYKYRRGLKNESI